MRITLPLALVLLLSTADAVPADAQVIAPPPRSADGRGGDQGQSEPRGTTPAPAARTQGGIFGGRRSGSGPNDARQELTTSINVLGAYESNLAPENQLETNTM